MDLLKTNFPWIITASAVIGTSWRYIMMVFSWVRNLVIVKVHINNHDAISRIREHFTKNFKAASFAEKTYGVFSKFIPRLDGYREVFYKTYGNGTIFFKGRVPILMTGAAGESDRNKGVSALTISYIRGTFDFEAEGILASNNYNKEISQIIEDDHSRYRVQKHFGTARTTYGSEKVGESNQLKGKSEAPSHDEQRSFIPLNFSKEDLLPEKSYASFTGLSYPGPIKDAIKKLRHWRKAHDWFSKRSIPWTRSIRLRGLPGTGKTLFAKNIAYDLNMPIHIMDLSSMTNRDLSLAWEQALEESPAVVLFEDLDRLFDKDRNFLLKELTLDFLLNCMSGVSESNGLLIISTVNFPERLDLALGVIDENGKSSRPGRLDFEIVFEPLNEECRHEIATRILDEFPSEIEAVVKKGEGETGAQFTHRCCERARELWEESYERRAVFNEKYKIIDGRPFPKGATEVPEEFVHVTD